MKLVKKTAEKSSIFAELGKRSNNAKELAWKAVQNTETLADIFESLSSNNTPIKYKAIKVLNILSQKNPQKLYPKFDFFVGLLDSKSNVFKWNAMDIIANLLLVDFENKFDKIFEKFYGLLHKEGLVTAAHVVGNSGKIAKARPAFRNKITNELLGVAKLPFPTKECRNILIGKAINSFIQYIDEVDASDRKKIIEFTKKQLNNSRKGTRAKAEQFLKKMMRE